MLVQGAHDAASAVIARRFSRSRAKVILDVHGDWRTATRLYGSRTRRLLNPFADRIATWAVRHVDEVRTVSDFTTGMVRELGVEPVGHVPGLHGPGAVSRSAGSAARAPGCAVRRRAGALQRGRPARGSLAACCRPGTERIASADRRGRARRPRAHARRARPERHLGVGPRAGGGRRRARRRHVPRAPFAARGHGPRRRRGVLPRPAGRGRARRGNRGSRRSRRERPALSLGRRRRTGEGARKGSVKSRAGVRSRVSREGRIGTVVCNARGVRGASTRLVTGDEAR